MQDVLRWHKCPLGRSACETLRAQCFYAGSPCSAVHLLAPMGGHIPSMRSGGSQWDGVSALAARGQDGHGGQPGGHAAWHGQIHSPCGCSHPSQEWPSLLLHLSALAERGWIMTALCSCKHPRDISWKMNHPESQSCCLQEKLNS